MNERHFRVEPAVSISYGPLRDEDEWTLRFTGADGDRVSITLDETAMYELWIEVKNRPWPGETMATRRSDALLTELVTLANGADEEQLERALDALRENTTEGSDR